MSCASEQATDDHTQPRRDPDGAFSWAPIRPANRRRTMGQTDEIKIRAMEPADLPDLAEAWTQPLAMAGTLGLPYRSLEFFEKRHAAGGPTAHLVAVIGGKAVGSASLHRADNRRVHTAAIGMA